MHGILGGCAQPACPIWGQHKAGSISETDVCHKILKFPPACGCDLYVCLVFTFLTSQYTAPTCSGGVLMGRKAFRKKPDHGNERCVIIPFY